MLSPEMSYTLFIDGKESECVITDDKLEINQQYRKPQEIEVSLDDIIAIEKNDHVFKEDVGQSKGIKPQWLCKVHFITRKNQIWTQTTINVTGKESICQDFFSELQRKFTIVADKRPKRLLLLVNPVSGNRNGTSNLQKAQPLFELAQIVCDVKVSERANHFEEMVKEFDFSTVDGLVIFGGDGSCSQVINVLIKAAHEKAGRDYNDIEGEFEPSNIPIGVIPSGTGNWIARAAFDCYDPITAALHIIKGNTKSMCILGDYCDNELLGFGSIVSAYGLFADLIHHTDQNRWLGKARYIVTLPYYLLFKTPRLFTAHITMRSRKPSDAVMDGNAAKEMEETLDGEFSNIMILPVSVNSGRFGESADPSGTLLTYLFRQTSRTDLVRFLMKWGQIQMPKEGELPTILPRQVNRIRINVEPKDLGDKNFLNYFMNIDGELHTIKKADITIKLIKDAFPLYSSLKCEAEPTSQQVCPPKEEVGNQ